MLKTSEMMLLEQLGRPDGTRVLGCVVYCGAPVPNQIDQSRGLECYCGVNIKLFRYSDKCPQSPDTGQTCQEEVLQLKPTAFEYCLRVITCNANTGLNPKAHTKTSTKHRICRLLRTSHSSLFWVLLQAQDVG